MRIHYRYLLLVSPLCFVATLVSGEATWAPIAKAGVGSTTKLTGKIISGEGGTCVEPARVGGRLVKILRREGETVKVGSTLFEISSADCTSLTEEKKVADTQGLQDLIEATNRRSQQLGLRIEKGRCLLVATHSGTIVKRQVELGAAFNVGDSLLTILDTRHLIVELDVPERILSSIHETKDAKFSLAADPTRSFVSKIDSILPTIDPLTRTTKVRLKAIALPPHTTLDSLVFAEISGSVEGSLLKVPTAAFVFYQNHQYLVKKTGEQQVAVPVEIVDEGESFSSVRALGAVPLHEGDEIAVKGAIFLFHHLLDSTPPAVPHP